MGGWGVIEIKAKFSPAKAGDWAELGKTKTKTTVNSCHYVLPART
jgi:hypothetical protein